MKTIIKKEKICNRLASDYVFGGSLKSCVKNLIKYILVGDKISCVCRDHEELYIDFYVDVLYNMLGDFLEVIDNIRVVSATN